MRAEMIQMTKGLAEARETAAQLESRVCVLEGWCGIMMKHDPFFHGKAAQIQAAVRRWRIKLHLGGWFRKSIERRMAAAKKVAREEEMFLGEVRRQLDMEEAAREARRKEQGMVALEAVWASRAEGWRAECEHRKKREKEREHRRQLVERCMMFDQSGFVYSMDGGSSKWRNSTASSELYALFDEMEEDATLSQMMEEEEEDEDLVKQWWVEGMKYEDEW
jgi:hypothetical protein